MTACHAGCRVFRTSTVPVNAVSIKDLVHALRAVNELDLFIRVLLVLNKEAARSYVHAHEASASELSGSTGTG